jgi:hypothetical protein
MEVEDVAWTPEQRAAAVHYQLGDIPGPIPVHAIARALDIYEIREKPLRNFEGYLQTDAERSAGAILVNSHSSYVRRRYTVGHELGHFLCPWHRNTEAGGFRCTKSDMTVAEGEADHLRQEKEANRFAIELLAPGRLLRKHLRRLPELERVVEIASELEISKTAAARCYVDRHGETLAALFLRHDRFIYAHRGPSFPWLPFNRDQPIPTLPALPTGSNLSEMVEADPEDWLGVGGFGELALQVLRQEDGHAIILLHIARAAED